MRIIGKAILFILFYVAGLIVAGVVSPLNNSTISVVASGGIGFLATIFAMLDW